MIENLIYIILNLDKYIGVVIQDYGAATYLILFIVLFCETGLVFTPFLPGDSLLFILGAFAAKGFINITLLFVILSAAAILGDTANYWIGKRFGEKALLKTRLLKEEHIAKTKEFFHKHGGITIVIARFMPVIRTFAPFVAGIGKMKYGRFLSFNVAGGLAWVGAILFGGYFFGAIPFVQENLSIVILLIIFISFMPAIAGLIKHRLSSKKQKNPGQ
jgi:membrane-associated protein